MISEQPQVKIYGRAQRPGESDEEFFGSLMWGRLIKSHAGHTLWVPDEAQLKPSSVEQYMLNCRRVPDFLQRFQYIGGKALKRSCKFCGQKMTPEEIYYLGDTCSRECREREE